MMRVGKEKEISVNRAMIKFGYQNFLLNEFKAFRLEKINSIKKMENQIEEILGSISANESIKYLRLIPLEVFKRLDIGTIEVERADKIGDIEGLRLALEIFGIIECFKTNVDYTNTEEIEKAKDKSFICKEVKRFLSVLEAEEKAKNKIKFI
ncbi:MAG: hypothetical protein ACRCYA_00345 [Cetobacterium sp.]|uniref:hypothetical protein n=1 Tax=Cetobacterium sp. TaxID=2071632 RepID=UPI003F32E0F3